MFKKILWLAALMVSLAATAPVMAATDEQLEVVATATPRPGGVRSIEERIERLEEAVQREPQGPEWFDRLQFGGLVEVEASYAKVEENDPTVDDDEASDLTLATVELWADAKVAKQLDAHLLVKYEEEDLFLDEGFITLSGTEAFPAYLIAGRQYLPFGNFDSHFVTDPTTLVLGETNEDAAVAGYRFLEERIDLSLGLYKGKARELDEQDHINSLVGAVSLRPTDNILLVASYTNNLAGSDTLSELVVAPEGLASLVGGWSASASIELLPGCRAFGEYLAATESFRPGELYDEQDDKARKPAAWNLEVGYDLTEDLEMALRYGGSDDGADLLPEAEYGVVLNWNFIAPANLALEYLRGDYEDDLFTTDTVTAQLAVEF